VLDDQGEEPLQRLVERGLVASSQHLDATSVEDWRHMVQTAIGATVGSPRSSTTLVCTAGAASLFLASDEAAYVTGADLTVEGCRTVP
jgi:NAD(P)-dependent dehydrogenase (short-subunit alcohol dehydrogenase family)